MGGIDTGREKLSFIRKELLLFTITRNSISLG